MKTWSPATLPLTAASCVGVYVLPDTQTTGSPPSSEHWNTASGSSETNSNVGVVSVEAGAGPLVISTLGGVVSPISHS